MQAPTTPKSAVRAAVERSNGHRPAIASAIDIGSHQQVWSYAAGGALALSKQGVLFIAQQSGRLAAIKVQ